MSSFCAAVSNGLRLSCVMFAFVSHFAAQRIECKFELRPWAGSGSSTRPAIPTSSAPTTLWVGCAAIFFSASSRKLVTSLNQLA